MELNIALKLKAAQDVFSQDPVIFQIINVMLHQKSLAKLLLLLIQNVFKKELRSKILFIEVLPRSI